MQLSEELSVAIEMQRNGNVCAAITIYHSSMSKESSPELYFLLGTAYYQIDDFQSSVKWLEKSLGCTDRYSIRFNLGLAYEQVGNYEAAELHLRRAVSFFDAGPESAVALLKLYRILQRNGAAERLIVESGEKWPESVQLLLLSGEIYRGWFQCEEAKHYLSRAVDCQGVHHDVFYNLAMLEKQCGDYDKAVQHFLMHHELTNNYEGILQVAQIYLLQERYAEAWPLYAKRITNRDGVEFDLHKVHASSDTLCIKAEQGVGDEVFFSRLLWKIKGRFSVIYYECDPRLVALLHRIYPFVTFVERGRMPVPKESCVIYAGDLPGFYVKRSLDVSKVDVSLDPGIDFRDKDEMIPHLEEQGRPIIGVSLFTRSAQQDYRMPDVAVWEGLLEREGCSFVNLQSGYDDLYAQLPETIRVKLHNIEGFDLYNDFVMLCGLIQRMDCVVTVDNYIAHLCGLLGTQCIVLLPYTPDWRWIAKDGKSLWYPGIFVAKQSEPYQWGGAANIVKCFLDEVVSPP